MAVVTTVHVPVHVLVARPTWTSDLWAVFNQAVENIIRQSLHSLCLQMIRTPLLSGIASRN